MQERLLILRSDRIGDNVIFAGALGPIRRHWPDARIDLMVQPAVRGLYARCPHVDRVVSISRLTPWEPLRRVLPRGTWALERWLLAPGVRRVWLPRYDRVIVPVSAPTEDVLRAVRVLKAPEKIGYGGDQLRLQELEDRRNAPEQVFTQCYLNAPEDRWMHEWERTKRFLRFMDVDLEGMQPELWLSGSDRRFARAAIPVAGALGFFIGAGSHWRQWPAEKWIALARRLERSHELVLLGGREDRALGRRLAEAIRALGFGVRNLAGRTKLGELAACIRRCRAVVSNDSCGLHLAVAGGVPAVGILGGYHFGRFYPWGDARIHRVANRFMDCYFCNDACIYGDWRCVSSIEVDTVERELRAAIENAEPAAGDAD